MNNNRSGNFLNHIYIPTIISRLNGMIKGYIGIRIWVLLRVISSVWVGVISIFQSSNYPEYTIPSWPPSISFVSWCERFLLSPWHRWDAVWYHQILTEGYLPGNGTSAFHPLFPLLAKPLYLAGVHPEFSLLIVSGISSLVMLYLLERLARAEMSLEQAQFGTLVFLSFPIGFSLFAPYTEGVYLMWVIGGFISARNRNWLLAGLIGSLATLTRQQGIFLLMPFIWELWNTCERDLRRFLLNWRAWLSFSLIPISYVLWILYRIFFLGEQITNVSNFNDIIHKILLSTSTTEVVPSFTFIWPWKALALAIERFIQHPDIDLGVNLTLGGVFIIGLIAGWKFMRPSYLIYVFFITLVSFSDHTGIEHPYMGLPRHLWLGFPVFLVSGLYIKEKLSRVLVITFSVIGYFFLLLLYVLEAWIP